MTLFPVDFFVFCLINSRVIKQKRNRNKSIQVYYSALCIKSQPVIPGYHIYYIKLKSHLSVCLCHVIISVVSAWIHLGLGLCIAESFETCMDVFSSFYQLSAGCRSTKETMMSSNLFLFSVAVKLENSVDSRER